MDGADERKWGRVDPPAIAQATVRAAAACARGRIAPGLDLFIGGKSFGARMFVTSAGGAADRGAKGLVLVGFPLHLAKKPSIARAQHLRDVHTPILLLQGTRDAATLPAAHARNVCASLPLATLMTSTARPPAFAVLVRSGRTHGEVIAELADVAADWMTAFSAGGAS